MAASALSKTMMLLEEFRKIDPEMPMQVASILLLIARKREGMSLKEIQQLTGLGRSSTSRHVAALAGLDPKSRITTTMVNMADDPSDRRYKIATLTPAGERFIRSIEHLIDET